MSCWFWHDCKLYGHKRISIHNVCRFLCAKCRKENFYLIGTRDEVLKTNLGYKIKIPQILYYFLYNSLKEKI